MLIKMEKPLRRAIQKADRYVRNKKYTCLFPGCGELAIGSHAIQRASIAEGLAEDGVVYTLRPSYCSFLKFDNVATSFAEPMDVVPVGLNEASVFRGYCAAHDARLFAGAEQDQFKDYFPIPLHLRAMAFEYCNQRRTADYLQRVSELADDAALGAYLAGVALGYRRELEVFRRANVDRIFAGVDRVQSTCIPLIRNLNISCCGCFDYANPRALIAYNVVSYAESSFVLLTTFGAGRECLDSFLAPYELPSRLSDLINELTFLKGEGPLFAPQLWRSLTNQERLQIGLALRPGQTKAPQIIRVTERDLATDITSKALLRFAALAHEHPKKGGS